MSIRRSRPTVLNRRGPVTWSRAAAPPRDADRYAPSEGPPGHAAWGWPNELETKLRLLQRAHNRQRCVMAITGHDLRQPLQIIATVLDRLMRDEVDAASRIRLEIAVEEVERLAHGLGQLAETADETVDDEPRLALFPISQILGEVAEKWRFPAAAKGLAFKVLACDQIIESDPALLLAAIDNLVGNAVKYTAAGRVLVGCRRDGLGLRIEVWDTGPGLSSAQAGALFGADPVGPHILAPLGSGLAIVHEATKLMGYSLRVHADAGLGSGFSLGAVRAWGSGRGQPARAAAGDRGQANPP